MDAAFVYLDSQLGSRYILAHAKAQALQRRLRPCGWRIVIFLAAGHVTLLHSVAGLARIELLVADFKGIRAG